MTYANYRI